MKKADVENSKVDAEQSGNETVATIEPGTVTPEQLAELKDRAAKADEHWDRLLRTTADLENFKKRAAREKDETRRFANETILQKLIPILDNFDMALTAAQNSQTGNVQSLQAGINMIHQQLRSALAESGLEEVDASGKMFDPNLHEAVSQKETSEVPEGTVVQQMRKGYRLRDRLLRPASVVVAKAPPGPKG